MDDLLQSATAQSSATPVERARTEQAVLGEQSLTRLNVADRLDEFARAMPQSIAIAEPTRRVEAGRRIYRTITFREMADDVNAIARGLVAIEIRPGHRLALLVPPSIDFITLVFALLKSGAVQILIDPGMGKRHLLRCLAEVEPEGFVAVGRVQAIRSILRRRFRRATLNVTVGRRFCWGGIALNDLRSYGTPREASVPGPECHKERSVQTHADDPAAIIFTSGSTGPPKGVLYRHGNFDRQVTEIRDMYRIEPGEIDLPCFPLFGLFNAAMGVTTVLPRMNFSRPAAVDPRNIVEAIQQWQVTQSFASPAVWKRVGAHCEEREIRLNSLRRVISAGAPVHASVLRPMKAAIPAEGEIHVPYGATEALPVATITATEVLADTWRQTEQGRGICAGRRFPGIEWRVIGIVDGPIRSIDDAAALPAGQIGELIVRGPVVTSEYVTRREANTTAKIMDSAAVPTSNTDASISWHRMGDAGYFDEQDRFWFCGRVAHRVTTESGALYTIPIEAHFNVHARVGRSALVGVGFSSCQQPAVVLELAVPLSKSSLGAAEIERFKEEMRSTMRETAVRHLLVYPRDLPVDVRHNAKIAREQLAIWAEKQLRRRRTPRCVLLKDVE